MDPLLPLFRTKYAAGFPDVAAVAVDNLIEYVPLSTLLTTRYESDAHLVAYACPTIPRRLNVSYWEARATHPSLPPVQMMILVVEVDGPNHKATPQWLERERRKLQALGAEHAGAFAWSTNGGYRLVAGTLREPI